MTKTTLRSGVVLTAVVVLLAVLPLAPVGVRGLLPGPFSTPGTLQLLATCLILGALALTFDLVFGHAGLLSFGHALYFAIGIYGCAIAITRWHVAFVPAILGTVLAGAVVSLLVGALCLRVRGIAFAMVTLAFAQAASVVVLMDPGHVTGGEEGLGLDTERVPAALVGVLNTRNLYWLALGLLVVVYAIARWVMRSESGRIIVALRENELRARVLGLAPFGYRLMIFTVAGTLATVCGVAYLLVIGGASYHITDAEFSLTILVMVVLGGMGSRWGAVLGGIGYHYLDDRLTALSGTAFVQDLPAVLRAPLSQPLFLLGAIFIIVVLFLPGGVAGIVERSRTSAAPSPLTRLLRRPRPTDAT